MEYFDTRNMTVALTRMAQAVKKYIFLHNEIFQEYEGDLMPEPTKEVNVTFHRNKILHKTLPSKIRYILYSWVLNTREGDAYYFSNIFFTRTGLIKTPPYINFGENTFICSNKT